VFVESVVDDVFCEMGKATLDLRMPSLCHGAQGEAISPGKRPASITAWDVAAACGATGTSAARGGRSQRLYTSLSVRGLQGLPRAAPAPRAH